MLTRNDITKWCEAMVQGDEPFDFKMRKNGIEFKVKTYWEDGEGEVELIDTFFIDKNYKINSGNFPMTDEEKDLGRRLLIALERYT